jgi:murein DD-endopeptidase MepM/ murein hydrolase activator NlpD
VFPAKPGGFAIISIYMPWGAFLNPDHCKLHSRISKINFFSFNPFLLYSAWFKFYYKIRIDKNKLYFKNIMLIHFSVLFFFAAFTSAFAMAVTEPADNIDFTCVYDGDTVSDTNEILCDDLDGDENEAVYGDVEDEDAYDEDEEYSQDFNSLFDDFEDGNFMYIDTSFSWDNKKINSGRFDYRTLASSDEIKIPLVTSSLEKKYTHPFANYVTSRFGMRGNRWHYGTDVKLKTGDPVKCAFDGIVRVIQYDRYGYGHVVVVRHHNGLETLYGHLSKVTVKVNDPIKAGDQVGVGGNTGRSTGSHLHFEIRYYGEPFNPEYIIDFDNYSLRNDTLVLTRNNFEYLTELRKTVYYTVRRGDTLSGIAKRHGTTVSRLCSLNGIKSTTTLRIGRSLIVRSGNEEELQLVAISDNPTPLSPGMPVPEVSTVATNISAPSTTASNGTTNVYYTVRKGDTLSNIARQHGATLGSLYNLNNMKSNTVLRIGQKIIVGSIVEAEIQIESEQPSTDIRVADIVENIYHTVRSGDTLSGIARLHRTTVNNLCNLNGIKSTTLLRIGQKLIVRSGA